MTATDTHRIAIVGVGKIARDQHVPSIARNPAFQLSATVSRHGTVDGVESFTELDEFLAARADVTAVALCVPPQVRYDLAARCLRAGRHVLLEKPPGATIAEVHSLVGLAEQKRLTLFATWHSRFAPAVPAARAWLATRPLKSCRIIWKEDVRRWHPGQEWIWQAGGVGVFDPGINALSIMTEILPEQARLISAELEFPENRDTPIAARLELLDALSGPISADFDWRQTGPQTWDIVVETADGVLTLSRGGAVMAVDGETVIDTPEAEYDGIYARFAELLSTGGSDVDLAPLIHVADAFMLGRRITAEPFLD